MNRIKLIVFLLLLSAIGISCSLPSASAFILDWKGGKVPWYIDIRGIGHYRLETLYGADSLNKRLGTALQVDVYTRAGSKIASVTTSINNDSLYYESSEARGALALDTLRELIIWDQRPPSALTRAAIGGGIMGGLALLAYVPPNPPNESPVSNVYILTGAGAAVGIAVGEVGGKKEIVIVGRMSEGIFRQ